MRTLCILTTLTPHLPTPPVFHPPHTAILAVHGYFVLGPTKITLGHLCDLVGSAVNIQLKTMTPPFPESIDRQ